MPARTRQSRDESKWIGIPVGRRIAPISRESHQPSTVPVAPPSPDSNKLSVISWRRRRTRLAPSETRTAISRLRAAARAKKATRPAHREPTPRDTVQMLPDVDAARTKHHSVVVVVVMMMMVMMRITVVVRIGVVLG